MSLDCNCPLPTALETILGFDCPEEWGQISKIWFQRRGYAFTDQTAIETGATVSALSAAVDDTKMVQTPIVVEVVINSGEVKTEGGGDNSTFNGIAEVTGLDPSSLTGAIRQAPQSVIKTFKELMCEKSNLQCYFVTNGGKVIASQHSDGVQVEGFKVEALGVRDKDHQGFGTADKNFFQMQFSPNWSDNAIVTTPADYDPFTVLD